MIVRQKFGLRTNIILGPYPQITRNQVTWTCLVMLTILLWTSLVAGRASTENASANIAIMRDIFELFCPNIIG